MQGHKVLVHQHAGTAPDVLQQKNCIPGDAWWRNEIKVFAECVDKRKRVSDEAIGTK